jgi:hypothetical protein
VAPPQPPSGDLVGHAIFQINSARAAYGVAPLALDPAITAVSYAHAYDQAANGYYDHWSRDGRSPADRLRGAGIAPDQVVTDASPLYPAALRAYLTEDSTGFESAKRVERKGDERKHSTVGARGVRSVRGLAGPAGGGDRPG